MLDRDAVKARLDGGGISFTEFSYQILQALDFLELYRRHDCTLQVGGSDQWGNLVAGIGLIREGQRVLAEDVTMLVHRPAYARQAQGQATAAAGRGNQGLCGS